MLISFEQVWKKREAKALSAERTYGALTSILGKLNIAIEHAQWVNEPAVTALMAPIEQARTQIEVVRAQKQKFLTGRVV